jgi:hypothetical protein
MERQLAAIAQSESGWLRSILSDAAGRDPIVEAFLDRIEAMEDRIETLEEENELLQGDVDYWQWLAEARPTKNVRVDPRGRKHKYRQLIFKALEDFGGAATRKEIAEHVQNNVPTGSTSSMGSILNAVTAMVKEKLLFELADGSVSF